MGIAGGIPVTGRVGRIRNVDMVASSLSSVAFFQFLEPQLGSIVADVWDQSSSADWQVQDRRRHRRPFLPWAAIYSVI